MHVRRARDWRICTDQADEGLAANWCARAPHNAVAAPVPGIIQQVFPDYHGVSLYWCELPPVPVPTGHRALINFESADYAARAWLNGNEIGFHEGDGVPFELDATEYLAPDRVNLLAVRVVNPTGEPIDGLTLNEVPHANKVLPAKFRPGWSYNFGGITGEVVLHIEPAARLLGTVVRSQLATGVISVDVTVPKASLFVPGAAAGPMVVSVLVSEERSGLHVAAASRPVEVSGSPGDHSVVRVELQVPPDEVRPWDVDDPFLYLVRVQLEHGGGGAAVDERTVRTGFRELRLRDGWFELNGRRIYLRSTHTGTHYPIGQVVPQNAALVRQDLVYAKAAGFNTVRFFPEAPDVAYIRSMAERFLSDWDRFGMDGVYCFPEDALGDSQLNQSLHRATTFDLIRANGNISGYNLTGMLDHALTGEGAWTFWRRWKPCAMDTMAAGWAPLRWCLDVTPAVSFPGGEIDLNLSLANEDVLPPGRYPACVVIVGQEGWRWQRSVEVAIDGGRGPLAVPVLAERGRARRRTGPVPLRRVSRHSGGSGGRPHHYRGDHAFCPAHAATQRRRARLQRGRTGLAGGGRL